MSDYSNEPMVPESGPEMSLVNTWMDAFTKPREATYARIAAQPSASATKAFLWVFLASLLTSIASAVVSVGGQMETLRQLLPPEIVRELPAAADPSFGIGALICGAPIGAVIGVLIFAIGTALVQWAAKLFGGTGTFDKLAYTFSSIFVPYSVIASVLTLLGLIPFVGILTGLIGFALWIYSIILGILAVKAVNRLDTGKAAGAVLLPGLVIALVICCCILVGVSLFLPVVSETFQGIN